MESSTDLRNIAHLLNVAADRLGYVRQHVFSGEPESGPEWNAMTNALQWLYTSAEHARTGSREGARDAVREAYEIFESLRKKYAEAPMPLWQLVKDAKTAIDAAKAAAEPLA